MEKLNDKLISLEEIVQKLKSPQIQIEDALKCYENGVRLLNELEKSLAQIEGKIEELSLEKYDDTDKTEPTNKEQPDNTNLFQKNTPQKKRNKSSSKKRTKKTKQIDDGSSLFDDNYPEIKGTRV